MLFEEVYSESFNKDIGDSFQEALNSQPSIDSTSIRQSSRPNTTGTSTSNFDAFRGGGTMIEVMMILKMIEIMLDNNNKVNIQ